MKLIKRAICGQSGQFAGKKPAKRAIIGQKGQRLGNNWALPIEVSMNKRYKKNRFIIDSRRGKWIINKTD